MGLWGGRTFWKFDIHSLSERQKKVETPTQQFGHIASHHKPGHKVSNFSFGRLNRNKTCNGAIPCYIVLLDLNTLAVPFLAGNSIFSKQGQASNWYGHAEKNWIAMDFFLYFEKLQPSFALHWFQPNSACVPLIPYWRT